MAEITATFNAYRSDTIIATPILYKLKQSIGSKNNGIGKHASV